MDSPAGSPGDLPSTGGGACSADTYTALSDALNEVVADRYRAELTLLQYPSQGDFAWCYQNTDQVFNQWTLDYLSGRVFPGGAAGLAQLSGSGGLTELGIRLLGSLTYHLSTEDQRNADPAVLAVRDAQLAAITRMRAAGTTPTAANGAMLTVDPVTGVVSTRQPAYAVSASLATIQNALAGGGDTLQVTVQGVGGAQVTFTYPNCVLVGCGPVAWHEATGKGWWVDEPITEAFANRGRDVTGFAFLTPPPFVPGPVSAGGTAGHISGLLLSNPPTLKIEGISATSLLWSGRSPADDVGADLGGQGDGLGVSLGSGLGGALGLGSGSVLSPPVREVLAPFALLGLGVDGALAFRERPLPPANTSPALLPEASDVQLDPIAGPTVPLLQQAAYVVGAVVGVW